MLTNDHIILKALELHDLADRYRWLNDPDVTRFFTNLGAIPLTENSLRQWYDGISHQRDVHFSIYKTDGKHIGGAQLKSIDWRNRNAELGIFIGSKEEWGKGYCSQATDLLVKYAFGTLNLHRVWLRVDSENIAAVSCYEKVGFIKEGVFTEEVYRDQRYHDSIVMSIINKVLNP